MPTTNSCRRTPLGAALLALALCSATTARGAESREPLPPPSSLVFPEPIARIGEVYQFTDVDHRFAVENRGTKPIRILAVEPISTLATARFEPAVLPPGGRGEIAVHQPVGDKLGLFSFRFKVRSDDPSAGEQRLSLDTFVQSAYDPETVAVDFGEVSRGDGAFRDLEIASREAVALQFIQAVDAPAWLAAEPLGATADGGLRVRLRLLPNAPLGVRRVALRLRTDLARQPDLRVTLALALFDDVVAHPAHLDLGLARAGQEVRALLRLERRAGPPLAIDGVAGAIAGMTTSEVPCPGDPAPPADSCRALEIRYTPVELGQYVGALEIRIAGRSEPLPVSFGVLAVDAKTKVQDVGALAGAAGASLPFLPQGRQPKPTESAPTAPSTKREISIKWGATKEESVYGYLIYRATERGGPYVRLNAEIVRVPAGGASSNDYRYLDRAVEPGKTYYYYLDSVSRGGVKRRFSGVLSRTIAADAE